MKDFIDVMSTVSGHFITHIAVDGGASRNNLLLQCQADQLNATVTRPRNTEATSLGAALMAGLAAGVWDSARQAVANVELEATFTPNIGEHERVEAYANWRRAVERSRGWLKY